MISGYLKGRKLSTVHGSTVRPTADRVKEALFSILSHKTSDAYVLDLFAGSGGLGIEAISRGARSAVFVEKNPKVIQALRRNLDLCRINDRATVLQWDISKNLKCLKPIAQPFDLVFMDPPYGKGLVDRAIDHLIGGEFLTKHATIVAEHEPGGEINLTGRPLTLSDVRRYGGNQLSFLALHPEIAPKTDS